MLKWTGESFHCLWAYELAMFNPLTDLEWNLCCMVSFDFDMIVVFFLLQLEEICLDLLKQVLRIEQKEWTRKGM
jgi:hypothetical protein